SEKDSRIVTILLPGCAVIAQSGQIVDTIPGRRPGRTSETALGIPLAFLKPRTEGSQSYFGQSRGGLSVTAGAVRTIPRPEKGLIYDGCPLQAGYHPHRRQGRHGSQAPGSHVDAPGLHGPRSRRFGSGTATGTAIPASAGAARSVPLR